MLAKLLSTAIALALVAPPAASRREREAKSPPASSGDPSDDDTLIERATAHFKDGQRLFDAGRYLQAAAEFERSEAAIPAGETVYNIALSYERGGRPADALLAARRYLELPRCGRGVNKVRCANRREEVERTVDRLREKVSELAIEVKDGIEVSGVRIDDRVVPVTEFPIVLDPGGLEVEVLGKQPDESQMRVLRLLPGKTTTLRIVEPFTTPEEPAPPLVQPPKPEPEPVVAPPSGEPDTPKPALRRGMWAGLGLTLASAAAVGVLGGFTLHYRARFSRELCAGECTDPGATHPYVARARFEQLQIATNVMIGVTAALTALTMGLGIASSRSRRPGRRAQLTSNGLTIRF